MILSKVILTPLIEDTLAESEAFKEELRRLVRKYTFGD